MKGYREAVVREVQDYIDRSEVLRGDLEYCAGLSEVQSWVSDGQSQAFMEKALTQIRLLRLGYKPDSGNPDELLQARFARGGEKIVRAAISAANRWHDENFFTYKPEKKVGLLPYHCQL